jgi:2-C-methyl-D-erythritol 2,4-cyclodiphosphate synthase
VSQPRVGIGYDSHRFAEGGPLVLGGLKIDSDFHLAGHSDGDAIAHAITDAILGAAGLGDIGTMFSDQDPANKGADSLKMLHAACAKLHAAGFAPHNIDITVIAEKPKIAPHRDAMADALAFAMGIHKDLISIKGKTNEGMGWIGRGEGLACIAVVTISDWP